MRILYLHQFFVTPQGTGGTRSYEFARRLVESGDEVVMVTAADGPTGRRTVDGIDVVAVRGGHADYVAATASGYAARAAGFARFAAAATAAAIRAPRPDVVFATSPPLTMALPGIAAARRHGAPLVFEVRDLWPEAPIQMGALTHPAAQRAARELERTVYRRAAHIVALSPGMRDGVVAAGVEPDKVTLIPNAADLDVFSPSVDPGDLRTRLGLDGRFVCSYFGTLGEANDLDQVIQAAPLAPEVTFVIQGDGKRRPELATAAAALDNVVLLPAGDKHSAARLAAASDACMTIFKDVPILATNSPNKLFDTFAAGRAAIVNTDGWQRELVERNEAGVAARPGDPADLAERVRWLSEHPDEVRRMGANARRLAEAEFDRTKLAGRLRAVLAEAAGVG